MQKVMAQVFFVIFRALLLTERLNEEGDDLVKWRDIITNIFCVDCVCWFLTWVTLHSQNRMYFRILCDFLFYFTLVCCNVTIATACAYMNVCVCTLYTMYIIFFLESRWGSQICLWIEYVTTKYIIMLIYARYPNKINRLGIDSVLVNAFFTPLFLYQRSLTLNFQFHCVIEWVSVLASHAPKHTIYINRILSER